MNRTEAVKPVRDLIVLVIAAAVLGLVTTPRNPFLTGYAFHPYHLIAILMAAQYGYVTAMVSAVVLIGLYAVGGYACVDRRGLPILLDEPHSHFSAGLVLISAIAGSLYDKLQTKLQEVDASRQELTAQVKTLQENVKVIETANHDLRSRILEETTTFQTMYEMAEKLSTLEPLYLYPAVLEILTQHLGVEKCSFYLVDDQGLRLVAQRGWAEVAEDAKRVGIEQGVMGQVVREGKPVTLKDLLYKDHLAVGEKILAAPVRIAGGQDVVGVLAVEAIPFSKFNAQTVRAFCVVAEWASKAMANVEVLSLKEKEAKELDVKVKAEELEREWMVGRVVKQVEAKEFPEATIQQITSLGTEALSKLEEILLRPGTRLQAKKNVLSALEALLDQGHRLPQETYRSFSLDCFRSWYRFENYRVMALGVAARAAGEALGTYLEELQMQLRGCILRSLVLRFGRGALPTPLTVQRIREELPEADPLVNELLIAMECGDSKKIAAMARKRWDMEPQMLEAVAADLIDHPDLLMRATTVHTVGLAGLVGLRTQIHKLLADDAWLVRESAVQALIRLNTIEPDPDLKKLLAHKATADRDALVREMAHNWVSRWYPELLGGKTVHG